MLQFLILLISVLFFALFLSYLLFRIVFYVPSRKGQDPETIILPPGKIYAPFHNTMKEWIKEARNTPYEILSITSFDGLNLTGKYYEYAPGAPVELMFHGYRGNAERDLAGGMHRAFRLGHSALIVDQRGAGSSEGHVISVGINEHRDCLDWLNFAIDYLGEDCRIILTGISMGASTVLMAAGRELPKNVVGVLADCGFHSARDVICSVAGRMHLPVALLYPFVKLGAKLFGHFDLEALTPEDAVQNCQVPVLFFHGEADAYVPCFMSQRNYEACASQKKLVLIPDAGHGLCFPVAPERYIQEMLDFFGC